MNCEQQGQFENSSSSFQSPVRDISSALLQDVYGSPDYGSITSTEDRSASGAHSPESPVADHSQSPTEKGATAGSRKGITGEDVVKFLRTWERRPSSDLHNLSTDLHRPHIDLDDKTTSKLDSIVERVRARLQTLKNAPDDLRRIADDIEKNGAKGDKPNGAPNEALPVPRINRMKDQSNSGARDDSSFDMAHKERANNIADMLDRLRDAAAKGESPNVSKTILQALVEAQLKHLKASPDSPIPLHNMSPAKSRDRHGASGSPTERLPEPSDSTIIPKFPRFNPPLVPLIDK